MRGSRTPNLSTTAVRLILAACVAGVLSVVLAGSAHAHVTVQPGEAEGGGYAVVSFRVPNERDDASTTRLQVLFPEDQPVASVRTTPVPGWRITTEIRTLDEPLELHGQEVTEVVSQVTWIATGPGIEPGQFVDFDVSMGPLPESGQMVFRALQTYSSGEEVAWNQEAVDPAVEPERPAPVLTITAPAQGGGHGGADPTEVKPTEEDPAEEEPPAEEVADQTTTEPQTTADSARTDQAAASDDSSSVLPTVLSAGALLVSLAALFLAWRRRPA